MVMPFEISDRPIGVVIFSSIISALRWVILVAVLLLLSPYLLDYFDNARTNAGAKYIYGARDEILRVAGPEIRSYVPVRISGKDRTDWILTAVLIIAGGILGSIRSRVETSSKRRHMRKQVSAWKRDMHIDENSTVSKDLERKIESA